MVTITCAMTEEEIRSVKNLFKEYAEQLGIDLSFQEFGRELEEFPGEYTPPDGRLLLAQDGGRGVGCVGLRRIAENICEMKRLYVNPEYRRKRVGRTLAERIIEEARTIGYRYMRLDTLPWMEEALELYRSLGFVTIEPYRYNPVKGAVFMELQL